MILETPSFFVVRPFRLTSLLIYIYFPTSKKMAIICTLPSRFSDKNQRLYTGSLIRACTVINIIYMVSRLVTFKIMRRLKGCIGLHKNNLTKTRTKWRYGYCLKRLTLSLTYQWLPVCVRAWSLNNTYPVWETQTESWNDMRSLHIHLLWTGLSP